MQARERIPTSIMEKYKDTIFFMVDIDQCLMEAAEPKTIWIMPMGYEVEERILELYVQHLLSKPLDPFEERFGTYAEKNMQFHEQLKKPMIVRSVRKEVEVFAKSMGISKEVVREAKRIREQAEGEKGKGKEPAKTESASLIVSSARTRSTRSLVPLSSHAKKSAPTKAQVKASNKRKKDKSTRVYEVVSEDEEIESDEEVREIKHMSTPATTTVKPSGEEKKAKKKMKPDKPGMSVEEVERGITKDVNLNPL